MTKKTAMLSDPFTHGPYQHFFITCPLLGGFPTGFAQCREVCIHRNAMRRDQPASAARQGRPEQAAKCHARPAVYAHPQ